MEEHPLRDYLDFTYSTFSRPRIEIATSTVKVKELLITKGFPNFDRSTLFEEADLILSGVVSSKRKIQDYTLSSNDSKSIYIIDDGPFPDEHLSGNVYFFETGGPSDDPDGWFEWEAIITHINVEGITIAKIFDD